MTFGWLLSDNPGINKTPTKVQFGFTVVTPMVHGDTLTVLAHFANGNGIFTQQTTPFPVTIESGAPNCAATARTTTPKHLLVTLSNSGGSCSITGYFQMFITANLATNPGTLGAVTGSATTTKDTGTAGPVTIYNIVNGLSLFNIKPDVLYTSRTPNKMKFGMTPFNSLVAGDTITMLVNYANGNGVFEIQTTAFPVTIEKGASNCAATARTTRTTHLLVTLANSGSGTCSISGYFEMSISANLAANAATPGAVAGKVVTTKDAATFDAGTVYTIVNPPPGKSGAFTGAVWSTIATVFACTAVSSILL